MTQISDEEIIKEITSCNETIKSIINKDCILFRAPYGDYNEKVVKIADSLKMYTIQWDVDSLDWKDYGKNSIIKTVCEHKKLKNGSIVLLHNGSKYTALALDELLTNLEEQGYTFIALDKMIFKDNYYVDSEGTQKSN